MERTLFQMIKAYSPTVLLMVGWFIQPFGKWGELIFFLATLVAFFVSGYLFYINAKQRASLKEAERMKQLLSHERHDALNHIQVMMGYMMLKKTDRIETYLAEWVERARQERLLSEFRFAPLSVALVTLKYRWKQWDVKVNIDEAIRVSQQDEQRLYETIHALTGWLERQLADHKSYLQVSFTLTQEPERVILDVSVTSDEEEPVGLFASEQEIKDLQRTIGHMKQPCKLTPDEDGLQVAWEMGSEKDGKVT